MMIIIKVMIIITVITIVIIICNNNESSYTLLTPCTSYHVGESTCTKIVNAIPKTDIKLRRVPYQLAHFSVSSVIWIYDTLEND